MRRHAADGVGGGLVPVRRRVAPTVTRPPPVLGPEPQPQLMWLTLVLALVLALVLVALALVLTALALALVPAALVPMPMRVAVPVPVLALVRTVSPRQPRQAVNTTPATPTTQPVAVASMQRRARLRRHRLGLTTRWPIASMAGCLVSRRQYRPHLSDWLRAVQLVAQAQTQLRR